MNHPAPFNYFHSYPLSAYFRACKAARSLGSAD